MLVLLDPCHLLLIATLLLTLVSANPISPSSRTSISKRTSLTDLTSPLQPRSPVSASSFTDWPTNIVMLGGAQEFGLWIQPNSGWLSLCDITCLDMPAYALGACCSPTIDAIGLAAGTGACDFVGISGWTATITDDVGAYTPVGPPQTIISANCYSTGS